MNLLCPRNARDTIRSYISRAMNQFVPSATLALIAHNARKKDLLNFAERYRETLSQYRLIATSTTGEHLASALGLKVERKLSGPLGGDAQIASEVALGRVRAVIFLIDPLCAQPHEADIQGLLRLCNVHNVAVATNLSTAKLLIRGLTVGTRASASTADARESAPTSVSETGAFGPEAQSRPLQSRPAQSRPLQSRLARSRPLQSRPGHSRPLRSRPTESHPLASATDFDDPRAR
jgi:methylglyoxal synthase